MDASLLLTEGLYVSPTTTTALIERALGNMMATKMHGSSHLAHVTYTLRSPKLISAKFIHRFPDSNVGVLCDDAEKMADAIEEIYPSQPRLVCLLGGLSQHHGLNLSQAVGEPPYTNLAQRLCQTANDLTPLERRSQDVFDLVPLIDECLALLVHVSVMRTVALNMPGGKKVEDNIRIHIVTAIRRATYAAEVEALRNSEPWDDDL